MTVTVKKSDPIKSIAQALFIIYVFALFLFSFQARYVNYTEYVFYLFAGFVILYIAVRRKILLTKAHYSILLFCFVCFLSNLWAIDSATSMQSSISLLLLALLSIFVYQVFEKKDVDKLIKAIFYAGVALVFYTALDVGISTYIDSIFSGDRLGGTMNAANTFGVYCSVAFSAGLYLFRRKKWYYGVLMALIFSGILVSGSRNGFIITTIGTVLAFLFAFKKTSFNKKFFYLSLFAIFLFIVYKLGYFDSIFSRFEDLNVDAEAGEEIDPSFSSRLFMIRFGFENFFKKPFLGYGTANAQFLLEKVWAKTYLHNNYVELLVNVGIIGFAFYYGTHVLVINLLLKKRKEPFDACEAVLVLLVVLLAADMSIVFYYNKLTYIVLTMGMCLCRESAVATETAENAPAEIGQKQTEGVR